MKISMRNLVCSKCKTLHDFFITGAKQGDTCTIKDCNGILKAAWIEINEGESKVTFDQEDKNTNP